MKWSSIIGPCVWYMDMLLIDIHRLKADLNYTE